MSNGNQPDQSLGEEHLMPWERGQDSEGGDAQVTKNLFDMLGSDPEFADDEEQAGDESTSESQDSDGSEDEDQDDDALQEEDEEEEVVEDESEEDESEDAEEVDVFVVKVSGEDVEVTLEEALHGYQRQEDYTRKTQQVAEERKTYAAELGETRQVREQLGQQLSILEKALAEEGSPPDWEKLRKEDPAKFSNEYAAYQFKQDKLRQVHEAQAKLAQEDQVDLDRQLQARMSDEWTKLTEAIPAFKDKKVAKERLAEVRDYLTTTYGASQQDVDTIYDHRFILMADKARMWDESQTTGKDEIKRKKVKARVLKPGTTTPTRKSRKGKKSKSQYARNRQRLARSGRVEDAADALMAMDGDE